MPTPYEDTTRLHAPLQPFASGYLTRGGHKLYYEQSGNPDGIPVLFLHGGPGAGFAPSHRRLFDPKRFHAILFDQRGCGRSTPYASLEDNTTDHLVEDIEALRQACGVDQMIIFGGSWGSTLALAYGIAHPERCLGFILRGIFLGGRDEIDWFLYDMGRFYPEAFAKFRDFLPQRDHDNILEAYYQRMTSLSSGQAQEAAAAWAAYENSCATLVAEERSAGPNALAIALIEAHYFRHNCFMAEGHILSHVSRLSHLPATIINGRHDVICPPISAVALAEAWGPKARLQLIDDAGHSAFEAGILYGLLRGLDQLYDQITRQKAVSHS